MVESSAAPPSVSIRCGAAGGRCLASDTVNGRGPSQPAHKIKAFLDEHRSADVVVCTGSASVKGLAWLARQVGSGQRVTIVIGDMTEQSFAVATEDDRRVAAAFLRRGDVKVHNWYRQKPVKKIAHGKAVVALQGGRNEAVAALVGSANLTDKGLSDNLELMVRCDPGDLHEIDAYIAEATSHPPANDRLIGFMTKDTPVRFATKAKPQAATRKGGCLPALAFIPAHFAASLWARIKLLAFVEQGQSTGGLPGHAD